MKRRDASCFYCGEEFGPLQSRTFVVKETKPKGAPYRRLIIGSCCDGCASSNKLIYEYGEEP